MNGKKAKKYRSMIYGTEFSPRDRKTADGIKRRKLYKRLKKIVR